MTIKELRKRAESAGFLYTFGKFTKKVSPPHLVGSVIDSNNFGADNKIHYESYNGRLQLTTIDRDLSLEKKIKEEILYDVYWNIEINYINKEEVYNTSFYFNLEEEN